MVAKVDHEQVQSGELGVEMASILFENSKSTTCRDGRHVNRVTSRSASFIIEVFKSDEGEGCRANQPMDEAKISWDTT